MVIDGKYKIIKKCGTGGMSHVYLAVNESSGKLWAIKEMRKDVSIDAAEAKSSIDREIRILKRLHCPGIPEIADVVYIKDAALIVMDYIEGRTLKEVLESEGAQGEMAACGWGIRLCGIFEYLHGLNPPVIYRDLKPSNVILKDDGTLALIDFGAAREYKAGETEDTVRLGTRGYAAPEQYEGYGQTDARSDIYTLGILLYQLAFGERPCEDINAKGLPKKTGRVASPEFEAVIRKCTRHDPEGRYQSCGELRISLEKIPRRAGAGIGKRPAAIVLAAAFAGAIAACGIFYPADKSTESYEDYIELAQTAVTNEEREAEYLLAIRLDPEREEAYLGLLEEVYLEDDLFDTAESSALREILIEKNDNGNTNEEEFEKNTDGYALFCYRMGIAYFYKMDDGTGKKNAVRYFEIAAASDSLSGQSQSRALMLAKIGSYYSFIGVKDNTGDSQTVTWRDYWDDLSQLSEGDIVSEDNASTAILIYSEFLTQIISHAAQLKEAGVTQDEMYAQTENIKTHMETDLYALPDEEYSLISDDMAELEELMVQAERIIGSAY